MSIRCLMFLTVISFVGCGTRQANYSRDIETLLNLEKEAITKEFKNDTAFLSSIMDTTFIELSGDTIKNKHEVLKTIYNNNISNINNEISLDSFVLENPVVHVYENTAVVTFIMHTYRRKTQVPLERRTRFYDLWIKRDNQWKAATWQATFIK